MRDAAVRHFAAINDRFADNPRVKVILDDGRNYLHFKPPDSYDIIVSEPSNPWVAGVSGLFTDEFFADAREKLRPGGVFCQWFHYYSLSMDHIRLLVRTFARTFPDAAVFVTRRGEPTGDMILIGSKGPLRMWRAPEDPSLPEGIREALVEIENAGSQQILSGLAAGPAEIRGFGGSGRLNTDDLPLLEFQAPAGRFGSDYFGNLREILSATERTWLDTGPSADRLPTEAALRGDGFSTAGGRLPGAETRRGAMILTRFRPGGENVARWVLLGHELKEAGVTTDLFRLARAPGEGEVYEIAASLVGPRDPSAQGEITVGGHPAWWDAEDDGANRAITVGWFCPERGRAYFILRRDPLPAAGAPAVVAAALASRFPCDHTPR